MNFNAKTIVIMAVIAVFLFFQKINSQTIKFEKTESFFPNIEILEEENIIWGYLTTPENWSRPDGRKIKIAASVLKNQSQKENANAVVFIQGGPGASGIESIMTWLDHPLRELNDVILIDVRGTGFSEPRLCPDLGNEFLQILAKNQSPEEDERQKTAAAMLCKQELLNKGVDIEAYHSISIAKDIHSLKEELKYKEWNVYGVSYGTYIAQVYADKYPNDIKSLVLDSAIDNISDYYTENTSNYIKSLEKVFDKCKNAPDCNRQFPDLERMYYETIEQLKKEPLSVKVDKELIDTGKFTYNAEDFKVAIQQALYHKQLVEVIPLLIYQTYQKNESALGNLVTAFSSLLNMDYGVYYSVSCNETLPNNDYELYKKDAAQFKRLSGGVSFYKSDFTVCDKWNTRKDSLQFPIDFKVFENTMFPVLILAGGYDPITPLSNGKVLSKKIKESTLIIAPDYGHIPGFTAVGNDVVKKFMNDPSKPLDTNAYNEVTQVNFASDVVMNSGILEMGTSLSQLNPFFLGPLLIAILVMITFAFIYTINFFNKKYSIADDKVIRLFSVITSLTGIFLITSFVLAVLDVSNTNYLILVFGLPSAYNYLFIITFIFIGFLVITLIYFIFKIKKINERSIVFSVIFSNMLLLIYMVHWGIL